MDSVANLLDNRARLHNIGIVPTDYTLDFTPVCRRTLRVIWTPEPSVNFLVGVAGAQAPKSSPRLNAIHSQFERVPIRRETYVYSLLTETDDRGTHAEKKGPLLYVNLDRSEEESRGGRNPGNGSVLDRTKHAYALVDRKLSRSCDSRTTEQTRTSPLEVSREGVCLGVII
jgi:hypothetical protein